MNKIISIVIFVGLIIGGFYLWQNNMPETKTFSLGERVTVYKTLECGCCGVYTKYLEKKGVETEVINMTDLTSVKEEHGVPVELSSCHTSVVAGYVVEGHVPLEVIERLLAEKPDIKGIALPGMPSGTPGMPGPKTSEWVFYAIGHDGEITEFMKI